MAKLVEAWGIEVGSNAIKAMRLVDDGGRVRVAEFDILPFKQVLTTPDLDVDEQIQLGLDQLLARHDIKKTPVVISVPGHMAFARFAKLPPVEPKKIPDIVKFEAVQQIPFPIEQVEWDYQVFTQPDSPDVEVGIFAITRDRVGPILANYRDVGLRVDGLTLSPVAVFNAMAFDLDLGPDSEGMILMDIGTTATDIVIAEGGDLWLRTLPIGGNNFTEALERSFNLSFPKAEKLKREAATSKYARQIFQAMRPVFADLVQEIQRSIGYYQSLNRDAKLTRLLGFGSTFRLPGLQKFLKQQLQMEVERPAGFKKISAEGSLGAEFAEHAMNLATAYGLALQGLEREKITANILPRTILLQRLWRSKQPWFAAAAACMVLAVGAGWMRYSAQTAVARSERETTERAAQSVLQAGDRHRSAWQSLVSSSPSNPVDAIEKLRRVMDYRDLWAKIMDDIALAVASVQPPDPLLRNDYAEQRKIPRPERRRIYIDGVDMLYATERQVGAAAPGTSPPPGVSPYYNPYPGSYYPPGGDPELLGNRTMYDAPVDAAAPPPAAIPMAGQVSVVAGTPGVDPAQPQYFTVTVRGWTPYQDASGLILNHFVKWLQDNANRPDRPYKLVVSEKGLEQLVPRGGQPPVVPPPPLPGMAPPPEQIIFGSQDWRKLLPKQPMADEDRTVDWMFTFTWKVQLLPPKDARLAAVAPPPAASQPATTAPATAPERQP